MRTVNRQTGFSIVELMVVLVIAAVAMTTAAPSLGTFVKNNRLQSRSIGLMRTIHLARSEAAKRRTRVVLCRTANPTAAIPSCGGNSYTWTTGYLVFAAGNSNSTYEAGVDELLRVGMPASGDVTIRSNSVSNNNLEINPDGTTNEGGGTARFAICDGRGGSFGRQIDVSPVGRPKVTKGSAGDTVNCTTPT